MPPCPHFDLKIVQRSKRQSAVAASAYQSGERLFSEYDQKQKYYSIFYPPTVEPGLFIMPIQRQTNSGYRSAKCRVEDLVPTKDKTIELQNADAFQLHALYVLHRL